MYKIAVLGDKDSVLGFRALGLDVFSADSAEQARPILHRLAKEGYAIIYLTEQLANGLSAEMARYKDELTPAIILIPGRVVSGKAAAITSGGIPQENASAAAPAALRAL